MSRMWPPDICGLQHLSILRSARQCTATVWPAASLRPPASLWPAALRAAVSTSTTRAARGDKVHTLSAIVLQHHYRIDHIRHMEQRSEPGEEACGKELPAPGRCWYSYWTSVLGPDYCTSRHIDGVTVIKRHAGQRAGRPTFPCIFFFRFSVK